MADIKQITEIDLELAKEMGGVNEKLQNILEKQKEGREETNRELRGVNDHLKTLNGSVASHEKRLNDFGLFKKSVEDSATKKAQTAAGIRSTILSIVIPIVTLLTIWLIQHAFHIQLPNL